VAEGYAVARMDSAQIIHLGCRRPEAAEALRNKAGA
jgi:hypothetical protein